MRISENNLLDVRLRLFINTAFLFAFSFETFQRRSCC